MSTTTSTTFRARLNVVVVVAAVAALATLTVASAPPATAVVSPRGLDSCGSGSFCRWSGSSFQGQLRTVSATGLTNVSGTRPSFWNNRAGAVWLYSGSNGAGSAACYQPGRKVPNLNGWQASPGPVRLIAGAC